MMAACVRVRVCARRANLQAMMEQPISLVSSRCESTTSKVCSCSRRTQLTSSSSAVIMVVRRPKWADGSWWQILRGVSRSSTVRMCNF